MVVYIHRPFLELIAVTSNGVKFDALSILLFSRFGGPATQSEILAQAEILTPVQAVVAGIRSNQILQNCVSFLDFGQSNTAVGLVNALLRIRALNVCSVRGWLRHFDRVARPLGLVSGRKEPCQIET